MGQRGKDKDGLPDRSTPDPIVPKGRFLHGIDGNDAQGMVGEVAEAKQKQDKPAPQPQPLAPIALAWSWP